MHIGSINHHIQLRYELATSDLKSAFAEQTAYGKYFLISLIKRIVYRLNPPKVIISSVARQTKNGTTNPSTQPIPIYLSLYDIVIASKLRLLTPLNNEIKEEHRLISTK
jgi:hypothetical protein